MSKDIRGFVSAKEMKLEGRIIQISSEKIMNRKVCAQLQLYLKVTSDNKQTGRPGLREGRNVQDVSSIQHHCRVMRYLCMAATLTV